MITSFPTYTSIRHLRKFIYSPMDFDLLKILYCQQWYLFTNDAELNEICFWSDTFEVKHSSHKKKGGWKLIKKNLALLSFNNELFIVHAVYYDMNLLILKVNAEKKFIILINSESTDNLAVGYLPEIEEYLKYKIPALYDLYPEYVETLKNVEVEKPVNLKKEVLRMTKFNTYYFLYALLAIFAFTYILQLSWYIIMAILILFTLIYLGVKHDDKNCPSRVTLFLAILVNSILAFLLLSFIIFRC